MTAFALLGLLAPGPAQAGAGDRGMAPALSTADALDRELAPRRRAILVGIDRFRDPVFPPLEHAVHDAEALGEVLARARTGGFDEVRVLVDPADTTRDAIVQALAQAAQELRPEDELVVYFSGHGTRVLDPQRGAWRRFLIASDSRSGELETTALALDELQAWFGELAPARKALVLDACFSGDGKSAVRPALEAGEQPPAGPLMPRALGMSAGEAHLYATSAGRPSREDDRLGHGVYTYFLLEALSWGFGEADLNQDAVMTAYEAHDYARGRAIAYTKGVQVPEAAFRVVGEADLALAGEPEARQVREDALVYLYQAPAGLQGTRLRVDGRDRGLFPGTVPVGAGRHRIQVVDAEGVVLVDGHATLRAGRSYDARDLARVAQGPRRGVGARSFVLAAPALARALGSGAMGLEVWGLRRVQRGPAQGLTTGAALGVALAPSRELAGSGTVRDPRTLLSGRWTAGYQGDWRRLRYRAELAAGVLLLPPDYLEGLPDQAPEPGERPSEEGWLVGVAGARLGAGWVLTEGLAATVSVRAEGSWLELDPGAGGRWVPWLSATAGLELAI